MASTISYWYEIVGAPFESDQSHIAVAHGTLAEEIDTVFYDERQQRLGTG
jgi:hypothetical protein